MEKEKWKSYRESFQFQTLQLLSLEIAREGTFYYQIGVLGNTRVIYPVDDQRLIREVLNLRDQFVSKSLMRNFSFEI